jgi:hypothetical protein
MEKHAQFQIVPGDLVGGGGDQCRGIVPGGEPGGQRGPGGCQSGGLYEITTTHHVDFPFIVYILSNSLFNRPYVKKMQHKGGEMSMVQIDLKKEQEASLERPRYPYSGAAKVFFWIMDAITGKEITLSKTKLIEILASIPYRSGEIRQYGRMTRGYRKENLVEEARRIMTWGREAQDNEYWHLLLINEKMKEDGLPEAWYLTQPVPFLLVLGYILFTRLMALVNIRAAFLFNAEFEDHAEHVYAQFVKEHPEWEEQPAPKEKIRGYGEYETWADVFRRIGLDERDHRNRSFVFCGKPEHVAPYDGMPEEG